MGKRNTRWKSSSIHHSAKVSHKHSKSKRVRRKTSMPPQQEIEQPSAITTNVETTERLIDLAYAGKIAKGVHALREQQEENERIEQEPLKEKLFLIKAQRDIAIFSVGTGGVVTILAMYFPHGHDIFVMLAPIVTLIIGAIAGAMFPRRH